MSVLILKELKLSSLKKKLHWHFFVYFDPFFEQIKTNIIFFENNSGFVDSGFVV